MMKPVVLFVDDEPNILSGLRRMLRPQRAHWDMRFAEGGQAAIDLMATEPVDAVVSDMRMPDVDGAALLEHVGAVSPGVIRIILSGEADRALTMRTVGQSHRFFSKPCDAATIVQALDAPLAQRARLAAAMGNGAMTLDFSSLWAPIDAYERLAGSLRPSELDLTAVADALRTDPVLTVRVLQLVNSAYFGPACDTACLDTAVRHLGGEVLRDLAYDGRLCAAGIAPSDDPNSPLSYSDADLALAAQALARQRYGDDAIGCEAFLTGLTLRLWRRVHIGADAPLPAARAAMSAYLCRLMGLPDWVCDALERLCSHTGLDDRDETARAIVDALDGAAPVQESLRTAGGRA